MSDTNPYSAPRANIETEQKDEAAPPKGLGWPLFWRIMVFQAVVAGLPIRAIKEFKLLNNPEAITRNPPVILITLAGVLAASLFLTRRGLFNLVLGYRLNVSDSFIRSFSWALCVTYVLMAAVTLVLQLLLSESAMILVRPFISLGFLVPLCVVAPRFLHGASRLD